MRTLKIKSPIWEMETSSNGLISRPSARSWGGKKTVLNLLVKSRNDPNRNSKIKTVGETITHNRTEPPRASGLRYRVQHTWNGHLQWTKNEWDRVRIGSDDGQVLKFMKKSQRSLNPKEPEGGHIGPVTLHASESHSWNSKTRRKIWKDTWKYKKKKMI